MKWDMEVLSPLCYVSSENPVMEERNKSKWTAAENKIFENALAVYDSDIPDRWQKVAAMIPGKTPEDVIKQYKQLEIDVTNIEAGLVPIPGYTTTSPPFTLDWVADNCYDDGFCLQQPSYSLAAKRSPSLRPTDHERKKGVPWTEDEHKLFLMGLKKYGKGDWRNISRNFVVTRTPTQVASHAQKYFIRQLSGGKDKRRASIHDITTVNVNDTCTPSPENFTGHSPEQEAILLVQQANSTSVTTTTQYQWNQQIKRTMSFNSEQGNSMSMASSPYGISSYEDNLHTSYVHETSYIGSGFQMHH